MTIAGTLAANATTNTVVLTVVNFIKPPFLGCIFATAMPTFKVVDFSCESVLGAQQRTGNRNRYKLQQVSNSDYSWSMPGNAHRGPVFSHTFFDCILLLLTRRRALSPMQHTFGELSTPQPDM
jgi:hypothetical protein